jgi:hypothetical protein
LAEEGEETVLLEEEESKEIGDNGVRAEERDINNRIPFSV